MAGRWRDGIQADTRANQPAFGDVAIGTLYFVTDEGVLERSTGAAWVEVGINETGHDALDHTGLTGVGGGSDTFVGAKAHASGAQTLAHNTSTAIVLDAADDYDSDAFHDPASNNTRFTVPSGKDGLYEGLAIGSWASNATGVRRLTWRLNGTTVIAQETESDVAAAAQEMHVHFVWPLVATNYVELLGYQDSGGNLNLSVTSAGFSASIRRVSAAP